MRAILLIWAPVCLMAVSCTTKREARSQVKTSFGFDGKTWGGQGGDDSDKIRSKFAQSGWKIDETGQIRPERAEDANLYSGQYVGKGRDFKKSDANLSKREARTKEYKKPEYLDRIGYQTKENRLSGDLARESDFAANQAGEAGRAARTPDGEPGILAGLNPFRSKTARESGRTYRTGSDRIGTQARSESVTATGVTQAQMGFRDQSVQSVDDVKKLLHPEAFD